MKKLVVPAKTEYLNQAVEFVCKESIDLGFPEGTVRLLGLAVEEVFVNICSYAYTKKEGTAEICCETEDDRRTLVVTYIDSGVYFNPLEKSDPDVTLTPESRKIGGFGIYFLKKIMDSVYYARRDGMNILTTRIGIR